MPEKTEYFVGEKIDYSALIVTAIQENGETIEIDNYSIEPEQGSILSQEGKQTVEINYKTKKLTFSVNVEKVGNSMLLLKQIPKSAYYSGEKLDLSNLELEILKSDGTKEAVKEYTSVPADGTVLEYTENGKTTVTVYAENFTTTFDVSVYDVELNEIYIKQLPSRTNYSINEKIDLSGIIVEAVFNDGTKKAITDYIVETDLSQPLSELGKHTVKIVYLDKSIEFYVNTIKSFVLWSWEPVDVSYPLYSENQTLSAKFFVDTKGNVEYVWFRKNPNETKFTQISASELQNDESVKEYDVTLQLPKNNYVNAQYYCEVTFSNDEFSKTLTSQTVTVKQTVETGLPTVYINTDNGVELVNKDDKINSTVVIVDTDGTELLNDSNTTFGGRGNSTWGQEKKPYKIKLDKKKSLFGMPKHKQWMLIANYLDMSFMKNEMAFYLSEQLEMDWTIHGQFVNLIKNEEYLGLYWLGEQIKIDENRVNIDEDDDYLIELDVYYDEVWKFKSSKRNLPYMIKNDDSMTNERLTNLENKINELEEILYSDYFPYTDAEKTIYDNTFTNYIDVSSMAKFYLVNEIMFNGELGHPKSCYFTFDNTNNILKAGPVWDFDWAAFNKSTSLYLNNNLYYNALFKTKEFNDELNLLTKKLSTEKVSERIDQLSEEIELGVNFDGQRWGTGKRNPVGDEKSCWSEYVLYLEDCINSRLSAIKNIDFSPM